MGSTVEILFVFIHFVIACFIEKLNSMFLFRNVYIFTTQMGPIFFSVTFENKLLLSDTKIKLDNVNIT